MLKTLTMALPIVGSTVAWSKLPSDPTEITSSSGLLGGTISVLVVWPLDDMFVTRVVMESPSKPFAGSYAHLNAVRGELAYSVKPSGLK